MRTGQKVKNRWARGMCVILLLNVLVACGNSSNEVVVEPPQRQPLLADVHYGEKLKLESSRKLTEAFVTSKMTGPYGVYTNYKETSESDMAATGHEVLSESAGLMMRYYALTNQGDAFDKEWKQAEKTFEIPSGFSYRYSPKQDKTYTINASVDDLRIIRALYEAHEQFDQPEYLKLANEYGARFFKHNIKDDQLFDFYDDKYKMTNNFITLCYIDLTTLKLLPIPEQEQKQLLRNMESIMEHGYLSDRFPFYETRYHYDTRTYSSDGINTVESLLTILSLAEAGQHHPESIAYIKEQVQNGTLYGQYDKGGKPLNDIQSTAIYAITAMIGSVLQDVTLYEDSIKRMEQLRVNDETSPFFGAYGDPSTEMAFSFDNLMALLAYAH
ncbi:hypothetical protein [Paenibacillus sp. 1001270B_150601_E10]|uniref:hypothetical protein n=1 Tax=Paenibacillus sp. 1001270B_150601_E10 TaxID=2787079 RepID=UPI00189FB8AD|nr:hypothetical protein [Paenibacillus sp. 1001270B_150601_E10]